MFVLIGICLGLTYFTLGGVDFWLAHVFLGMIWGICIAFIWMMGSAMHTVEYWSRTCPRWIYILFGHPGHGGKKIAANIRYMKSLSKITRPLAVMIAVIVLLTFISHDVEIDIRLIETITYVITWLLSVYLSERYFRRRYTRVKDWSKFKPFDKSE